MIKIREHLNRAQREQMRCAKMDGFLPTASPDIAVPVTQTTTPLLDVTVPLALSKPSEYPEAFPSKRTLYILLVCTQTS